MKHIFFCTVLFFALAVFGSAKKFEAKLAEVDIGKGKITHIERITDGEFLHHSNKVLKNIPPAQGSATLSPPAKSRIYAVNCGFLTTGTAGSGVSATAASQETCALQTSTAICATAMLL